MKRNAVEWVVLAISVLAIVVVVGALVFEGLREARPADPQVILHQDEARQGAEGWIVPVTVRNLGDEAAEGVIVEATADVAGTSEQSELQIEFLPAGTAVDGAFAFSAQPNGDITARLVSFSVP